MPRLDKRSPGSHTVAVQGHMPHLGVHNTTWAATVPCRGAQAHESIYNLTQACTTHLGLHNPTSLHILVWVDTTPQEHAQPLMGIAQLHISIGTTLYRDTDPPMCHTEGGMGIYNPVQPCINMHSPTGHIEQDTQNITGACTSL